MTNYLTNIIVVMQLIILEGLLSFDNALALAAYVKKHLKKKEDQDRALMWGIWGAYIIRILTIFFGVWLMKYEWIKAAAGIYLIYISVAALFFSGKKPHLHENSEIKIITKSFWLVVLQVEIMDFMFSIDSIAVALAISNVKWVLITGVVIGVLLMRVAAQFFVKLIDKYPILEKTAFVLVAFAGLNILLKIKDLNLGFTMLTIDKPIPENIFLLVITFILVLSFYLNRFFIPKGK